MHTQENTAYPRVLHIASGDLWAGAEVQLFTLVKTLHKYLNVPVSVILLNHGELENKLRAAGIKVIVLDECETNTEFLSIAEILFDIFPLISYDDKDIGDIKLITHNRNDSEQVGGPLNIQHTLWD